MITIYTTDVSGMYSGSIVQDEFAPLPPYSTPTAPPDVPFAQLQGGAWVALDAYPAPLTPSLVVPQSVTMRQARLALLAVGLLPAVTAAIAAAGDAAQIEWEYANEVLRASGLVPAMATALGMTETQIDELFIAAAAL